MSVRLKKLSDFSVLDWCIGIDAIVLLICLIPGLSRGFYMMVSILSAIFCLVCFLDFIINKEWFQSLYFIIMAAYCALYPFDILCFADPTIDLIVHTCIFTLLAVVFIAGAIFETGAKITLKKRD